jgi:hypothetical protein
MLRTLFNESPIDRAAEESLKSLWDAARQSRLPRVAEVFVRITKEDGSVEEFKSERVCPVVACASMPGWEKLRADTVMFPPEPEGFALLLFVPIPRGLRKNIPTLEVSITTPNALESV